MNRDDRTIAATMRFYENGGDVSKYTGDYPRDTYYADRRKVADRRQRDRDEADRRASIRAAAVRAADACTFAHVPGGVVILRPPNARWVTIDVVTVPLTRRCQLDPMALTRDELVRRAYEHETRR